MREISPYKQGGRGRFMLVLSLFSLLFERFYPFYTFLFFSERRPLPLEDGSKSAHLSTSWCTRGARSGGCAGMYSGRREATHLQREAGGHIQEGYTSSHIPREAYMGRYTPLRTSSGRHIWRDIPFSGPPLGGIYGRITPLRRYIPTLGPSWEACRSIYPP